MRKKNLKTDLLKKIARATIVLSINWLKTAVGGLKGLCRKKNC